MFHLLNLARETRGLRPLTCASAPDRWGLRTARPAVAAAPRAQPYRSRRPTMRSSRRCWSSCSSTGSSWSTPASWTTLPCGSSAHCRRGRGGRGGPRPGGLEPRPARLAPHRGGNPRGAAGGGRERVKPLSSKRRETVTKPGQNRTARMNSGESACARQVLELDEVEIVSDAPAAEGAARHRSRRRRPAAVPAALHQPRVVLAAVQPPRARGGVEQQPSAPRAAALPVDLGRTISTSSSWCASRACAGRCARGIDDAVAGRPDAAGAADPDRRGGVDARLRPAAPLARAEGRSPA